MSTATAAAPVTGTSPGATGQDLRKCQQRHARGQSSQQGAANTSKGSNSDLNRLGGFSGALTQSNNDQGAEAIPASDLKTAEALGARVAAVALRLAREQESVAA